MKNKKFCKGSFTIEAAILMPPIALLLVMLVQVSFFLHNECCAWQSVYLSSLREERYPDEKNAEVLMRENSLGLGYCQTEQKEELFWMQNKVKGGVNGKWSFETESRVEKLRPVTLIRMFEKGGQEGGM